MTNGLSLRKTKIINLSTVIKAIYRQGPIDRASISRLTKLSPTTCTAITKTLIQHKVVEEVGEGASSGGRKPILLRVNKDYGHLIGVVRSEGSILVTLFNMGFEVLQEVAVEESGPLLESFNIIIEEVSKILDANDVNNILGMTISTHGVVDTVNQTIVGASSLKMEEKLSYRGLFEAAFDFPVFIENDSNIVAYGEKRLLYTNRDSLVHIGVGTGVGAGIVLGDRMIKGRYGYIGEIGHISMDRNGPHCYCGNKGCLETMASLTALYHKIDFGMEAGSAGDLDQWVRRRGKSYDLEGLLKAADAGNRFAIDLMMEEAELLYQAVICVVNLYDPEVITIGGFGIEFSTYLIETIKQKLENTIYKYQLENRTIVASKNDHKSHVVSSALYCLDQLLEENSFSQSLVDHSS